MGPRTHATSSLACVHSLELVSIESIRDEVRSVFSSYILVQRSSEREQEQLHSLARLEPGKAFLARARINALAQVTPSARALDPQSVSNVRDLPVA